MATPLRLHALAAKKESSYGTDPTPTATDNAVRVNGPLWSTLQVTHQYANLREDAASGGITPVRPGTPKGRIVNLEIAWEAKGGGSAYAASTDIEADPLFQACGYSVAVDTTENAEKVTYTPADTGHASCTIYAWAGGDLYKIVGCRGNLRWPVSAGENGVIFFSMTGMLVANPAAAALPSATYNASLPPAAVGMSFTIDAGSSYTPDLLSCEFNLGNVVEVIADGNATDGIHGIEIPERDPVFTCTIRKDALTSYNPWSLHAAGTSHTIDQTLGGTQYNRLKLDVDESYLGAAPGHVDYQNFAGFSLDLRVKDHVLIFD